jgi:precorrin-2 dehydrogenase/sirohydrochlorin ferrochelatase
MTQLAYPVALILDGRRCLVVGGGAIADGKLDALLDSGALVTVVSPEARPRISALAAEGRLTLQQRPFQPADLDGAFLVIAATDDRAVNAAVARQARAAGILVNAVDDPPFCDFYAVSVVRRGNLHVAISTNGDSPAFARWMRERLDATLPAEYGDLLALLAEVRAELRASGPIPDYAIWQAAITDDLLARLASGNIATAREQLRGHMRGASGRAARSAPAHIDERSDVR